MYFEREIKTRYIDKHAKKDGIRVVNDKNKIVRIQIGDVYILDLEPAEMAIYVLLLYYGSIEISHLKEYEAHLKKVIESAQSIKIDSSKNERTANRLANDKKLLRENISKINGKIQNVFCMAPELYRLYQINRFDTQESVKLIIDLDKKYITIPNFITAEFKAFDALRVNK